jgi:hypothetical protein
MREHRSKSVAATSLLFVFALGSVAIAQTAGARKGPEIHRTEDGIAYISTGVGFDSRVNLPSFALKLIFANKTNKYLAGIDTEITPLPNGKSTRIYSNGPWLLVDLPPGTYAVKATTTKGHRISKQILVTKGQVTQVKLVWNLSDDEI